MILSISNLHFKASLNGIIPSPTLLIKIDIFILEWETLLRKVISPINKTLPITYYFTGKKSLLCGLCAQPVAGEMGNIYFKKFLFHFSIKSYASLL